MVNSPETITAKEAAGFRHKIYILKGQNIDSLLCDSVVVHTLYSPLPW